MGVTEHTKRNLQKVTHGVGCGDIYRRKKVRVISLACNMPSQPDLLPTKYYKKNLKGNNSYEACKTDGQTQADCYIPKPVMLGDKNITNFHLKTSR